MTKTLCCFCQFLMTVRLHLQKNRTTMMTRKWAYYARLQYTYGKEGYPKNRDISRCNHELRQPGISKKLQANEGFVLINKPYFNRNKRKKRKRKNNRKQNLEQYTFHRWCEVGVWSRIRLEENDISRIADENNYSSRIADETYHSSRIANEKVLNSNSRTKKSFPNPDTS